MAEEYTAWLWRARAIYGARRWYTTRHHMDDKTAKEYFAGEGITEYSKVETSAVARQRLNDEERADYHSRNIRPGDPDYPDSSPSLTTPRKTKV